MRDALAPMVATHPTPGATAEPTHEAEVSTPKRQRAVTWRELRERTGLSLRELEAIAGISRGEISKIERGRASPSPDQARRLLAALDEAGA